jgi:hypothetical protein
MRKGKIRSRARGGAGGRTGVFGIYGEVERQKTTRTMRGTRTLNRCAIAVAVVVALVLGVIGGAFIGYLVRGPIPAAPSARATYLFLTIGFDFATGLDRYFPANFTVPSHVLVVVTITNYDNASNPVTPAIAQVQGTLGNVETMHAASEPTGMNMSAIPADQVAHTFTLDSGGYSMNVPIAVAKSLADPMVVTFRAYFNETGAFIWHCSAPCDPVSMDTPGFMRGTITVVDT